MKYFTSVLLIIFFIPLKLNAQIGKVYPVDEGKTDSLFNKYYITLCDAVAKKDVNVLIPLLNDSLYIPNETYDYVPAKEFLIYYRNDNYKELWKLFESVISTGGGKFIYKNKEKYYYAPYTAISVIDEEKYPEVFEIGEYSVVLDSLVKVYSEKSSDSKILALLNYDIVKNSDFMNGEPWRGIELNDGRKGYVQSKFIKDFFDARAEFLYKNGKWNLYLIGYFE